MILTPEQIAWLVNLALLTLIEQGSVMFEDIEQTVGEAEVKTSNGEFLVESSDLVKVES